MTDPFGPNNLSSEIIDEKIKDNSKGAYILSRGGNAAHYVGRSDTNLKTRLKQHMTDNSKKYTQFWFTLVTSPLEAYYLECEWYHKYNPTDNENHPAVPPGAAWKCPVSGCSWSV